MTSSRSPGSIPLHCTICSKKPTFSDISHLLTHVASKQHLSNYYKAKVRGGQDDDARELVEEYDEWYEKWNVDDLMRERMQSKDKKSRTSSRRASAVTTHTSSARSTPSVSAIASRRNSRPTRGSLLDPSLNVQVKIESKSRSGTPGVPMPYTDRAGYHHSFAPQAAMQHGWSATPYTLSPANLSIDVSSPSQSSFEIETIRPSKRKRRNNKRKPSDDDASFQGSMHMDDEYEISDTTTDAAKLKGVFWPGMAMFDSATPDMKRKRNQKKAVSVVQQLLATSKNVEPTELIFDNSGALRKQRPIDGDPDYDDGDSQLSGEVTPEPDVIMPKKRPGRRPRPALTERDVNTGRSLRRRSGPHAPGFGNSRAPFFDGVDEEDDELTYGPPRPKKRYGMSIHRDDSGPGITFDNPAPFSLLSSGFSNQLHQMHNRVGPAQQPYHAQPQTNGYHQQPQQQQQPYPQQPYQRHQQRPSFGWSFRPSGNSTGMLGRDLSAFGNFSSQSMFQPSNHIQSSDGNQAWAAFQQQLGLTPQPQQYCNNQNFLGGQSFQNLDVFGPGNQDHSLSNAFDTGFQGADLNSVNPLFFSTPTNQPTREDDEATVSAPVSEHSPLS